ncbi:MAG TPA: gamma-glutamyl-gamma-aminobutyrate hydrolase family protein, partial [Bdellovibrionales bacterium]|nr:gamma-glutamyl-gamma-aminobutyrate hydrolase family protein [Bdellovibrionales bacterium]
MSARLRIGLSACFFHADPTRAIFKGKTLQYLEQSIAHWLTSQPGVLAYMIPLPNANRDLREWVQDLDGLVLQGGSDVAPKSYGEEPLRPEWAGDYVRDQYEIELFNRFLEAEKPVLGVCRGAQLMNVALGGTLYQDIGTQIPGSLVHRDWNIYDQNFHSIDLAEGSRLSKLYGGLKQAKVNSVHHQALKKLGRGLEVEAVSGKDKIVEAVRWNGP